MLTPHRYPTVETPAADIAPDGSRIKPFNERVRERLEQYQSESGLSQTELAAQLGVSVTYVSRYLNGKPEGDVQKLEEAIEDVLKQAARKSIVSIELFETDLSRKVNVHIETVRKTNDFGLLSGPAGLGKTCALELYLRANRTSILITASRWLRSDKEIEAALFDQIEHRRWKAGTKYSTFLIERLKGSSRTIIIDNAHRLRKTALAYLFDFHDATGCPVMLVGNPEVLEVISSNDQHYSRIGLHKSLNHLNKSSADLAATLFTHLWPECERPPIDLCVKVIERNGHLRALKKQILLAKELASKPSFQVDFQKGKFGQNDLPSAAFRAAHERLIRDYKL